MGVMMLFLKYGLLKKIADEEEKKAEEVHEVPGIEIGDIYQRRNEDLALDGIPNPLHSATVELVEKQKEELNALKEETKAQKQEILRLQQQQQQIGVSRNLDATDSTSEIEFHL